MAFAWRCIVPLGLAVMLSVLSSSALALSKMERRLLVPAFFGAGDLGTQVANTLGLQIYRAFRVTDGSQGAAAPFGRGILVWDPEALAEMSFQAAIERAGSMKTLAHI